MPVHGQPALPTGRALEDLFGIILRDARWPRETASAIPVCWEDYSSSHAAFREITRQAVRDTWERHSKVRFVGWEACKPGNVDVRIWVADTNPGTAAVGRYLAGRPQGVILNFSFVQFRPSCAVRRVECIRSIAVHEFGHVLGLTHEAYSSGAPGWCQAEGTGTRGDFEVTRYDPHSVMNSCNDDWNGNGQLSELDIQTVQAIYEAP